MIIFDSTYLVVYLHPNPKPAMDRSNQPVKQFKERVHNLIGTLNASSTVVGVPTPALAEVLVRSGKSRGQFLTTLSDTYRFEIIPFGTRAAIEASELIERLKDENKSQPVDNWAKIKFDIQITAIGKAESATTIYSDDKDIEGYAKRWKIPVTRICDLPVPTPPEPPDAPDDTGQIPLIPKPKS